MREEPLLVVRPIGLSPGSGSSSMCTGGRNLMGRRPRVLINLDVNVPDVGNEGGRTCHCEVGLVG